MIETIYTGWRKARKYHTCDYCGGKIHPGECYEHSTITQDGSIYTWKSHEKCTYIAGEIWDFVEPDEGMNPDEFLEGCSEVCRVFVCPDCGKWDTDECDESYCIDKLYSLLQKYSLYRERCGYHENWKLRERVKNGT